MRACLSDGFHLGEWAESPKVVEAGSEMPVNIPSKMRVGCCFSLKGPRGAVSHILFAKPTSLLTAYILTGRKSEFLQSTLDC